MRLRRVALLVPRASPVVVLLICCVPLFIAGCVTPPPAGSSNSTNHSTSDATGSGPAAILFTETSHDFSPPNGNPSAPITKTIKLPAGYQKLTLNVTWSSATGVAVAAPDPAPTAVDLLFPDKKEAAACDLAAGPVPSAPCTKASANAPEGDWTVEFEGASPGITAKVVVTGS